MSVSGFYNYQNNIVWSKADCKSHYFTEAQAQKAGARFAAKVGCGHVADVAACLRAVPAATLLADGGQVGDPTAGGTIGPIINGTTLRMSPVTALTTGHANHVTLITDVGRDEFNGGVYTNSFGSHIVVAETPAQYRTLVREQFGRAGADRGAPLSVEEVRVAVHGVPDDHGRLGIGLPDAATGPQDIEVHARVLRHQRRLGQPRR